MKDLNKAEIPNTQLSMFERSTRPKLIELTGMFWRKDENGDWVAKGLHGDFRLWKKGAWWYGRYCSYDNTKWFRLKPRRNVNDLKTFCKSNCYWEK